ncbi:unknown [Crocosphaera subtropica ATCC 51142]|uniref:Uncharacterized protein n=1 Tax=Crocosphaera subtropica (strain ATCC 51142 / BH68) TaxID=43989 RepID=B1WNR8_CROS5|nr:hypothetical protein [Crocosphaera subtropica]ACB51497.1 unknown [Crocosphaera subtropica ATCC 51142]
MVMMMDALVEKLNNKLHQWKPDIAEQVRQYITEIIELADQDGLELLHSRISEQEIEHKLETEAFMKLAETGFPEWNDPEEDIYEDHNNV